MNGHGSDFEKLLCLLYFTPMRRRTQVAKGEVCKTFIRRFDPDRRLQLFLP